VLTLKLPFMDSYCESLGKWKAHNDEISIGTRHYWASFKGDDCILFRGDTFIAGGYFIMQVIFRVNKEDIINLLAKSFKGGDPFWTAGFTKDEWGTPVLSRAFYNPWRQIWELTGSKFNRLAIRCELEFIKK